MYNNPASLHLMQVLAKGVVHSPAVVLVDADGQVNLLHEVILSPLESNIATSPPSSGNDT